MIVMRIAFVTAVVLGLAIPAAAFGPASDFADAAAYQHGWIDGDDGGTGFDYPWTFSPTLAPFTVESSTQNGDGDSNSDGDIDTVGKSFTIRTNGNAIYAALRFLTPGPLQIGDRVAYDFDAVGFGIDGFANCDLTSQSAVRFDLRVTGGEVNYVILDAAGSNDSGVPVTDEGIHVALDLTGADTYTLRVTPLGGATTERSGTLAGAGDIAIFRCGIANDASGLNVAYFNSVVVPEPGAAAAALAAALALTIAKRRRA
jgi:hypothetical protein